jgi:hypothetical protein
MKRMGRIHNSRPTFKIDFRNQSRCLICEDIVIDKELVLHIRDCSKLRIKSHFFNLHAIRYQILLYLFGIEIKLDPSIDLRRFHEFILKTYLFIHISKIEYPFIPNFSKTYFQQELYLIERIFEAILDFKVPILDEVRNTLIETNIPLNQLNSEEN